MGIGGHGVIHLKALYQVKKPTPRVARSTGSEDSFTLLYFNKCSASRMLKTIFCSTPSINCRIIFRSNNTAQCALKRHEGLRIHFKGGSRSLIFVVAFLFVLSSFAFAAVNTYQVTGPVLELTKDKIVVQKGKEKWEIALDASTKVPADVKVGSKVTIKYEMKATSIEGKPEKGKEKPKGK